MMSQTTISIMKYLLSMLVVGVYAMKVIPFWLMATLLLVFELIGERLRGRFQEVLSKPLQDSEQAAR